MGPPTGSRTEDEWVALYRETLRPLYAFVARRAGERALAEDVTQEAWLRAVADWPRRGRPDDPLRWLQAVAHNLLRNHLRRARPEPLDRAELALDAAGLEPATPAAAGLVAWGLARVGRAQARLLAAHHLDGQPLAALAADEGLSVRAVEGRLRRARLALRRALTPHLVDTGGRP